MAIDAVGKALDLFNHAVDEAVPWTKLKELNTKLDLSGSEFSKQSADRVGNIRTKFLNTFDAYDSATQSVYELCGYLSSTLSKYIQLFKSSSPAVVTVQKKLLNGALDNGVSHLTKAQKDLAATFSALSSVSEEFKALLDQLKIDYNENGNFFKNRLSKIVQEKSGFGSTFKKKQIQQDAIADLMAKIKPIETFYTDASGTVQQALVNFGEAPSKLHENLEIIEQQKAQLSALNADDVSEDHDAIIHSAEALIAKCKEYLQRHVK